MVPGIYSRLSDGSKTFHVCDPTPGFQKGDDIVFKEFDPTPVSATDKDAPRGLTGSPDLEYRIGFIEILSSSLIVFSLHPKNQIEQKPKKLNKKAKKVNNGKAASAN